MNCRLFIAQKESSTLYDLSNFQFLRIILESQSTATHFSKFLIDIPRILRPILSTNRENYKFFRFFVILKYLNSFEILQEKGLKY